MKYQVLWILNIIFWVVLSFSCTKEISQDKIKAPPLWGLALDGYPITEEKLKGVESEIGLSSDIVIFFLQWPSIRDLHTVNFPRESLENIWNRGAIPCLTWEPMYYNNDREIMVPYEHILNGSYDSYIVGFAENARLWGKPFMIRFAHEMNIERYHWGTDKSGYGMQSPGIYKKIFQYLVMMFRKAGAENVLWVFCPNAESIPDPAYNSNAFWNQPKNYYPGENYVDILGMDGYNWGTSQKKEIHGWDSKWKPFDEIFREIYKELVNIAPDKPIFVFETSSADEGGNKTNWIKDAFKTVKKWRLKGIIWFQVKKEVDWRINSGGNTCYIDIIRNGTSFSHYWIRELIK
ncbi:MAG: glycosyl hydrolase [Thermodesulfobacteriota bacterium]|nr:glycosyl hydrolase [Thermodesulfobacteriota bacterium]